MKQIYDSKPFAEFFEILHIIESHQAPIATHQCVCKFLSLIERPSINDEKLQSQNQERAQTMRWDQTLQKIEMLEKLFIDTRTNSLSVDREILINQQDEYQIIKVLKQCFMIAARCGKSPFFISKIMELSESSQIYFADLLKPICPTSPTVIHENPEIGTNSRTRQFCYTGNQSELIDKLYQCEQQIERLNQELRKTLETSSQAVEEQKQMKLQLATLKKQNEHLKMRTIELEQEIYQIKIEEQEKERHEKMGNQSQVYNNEDMHLKLGDRTSRDYKDEFEILKLQMESFKRKYESRINELQQQLRCQKQRSKKYRERSLDFKQNNRTVTLKYEQIKQQLSEIITKVQQLEQSKSRLEEKEATLKFELNYKNSQIQELKELIMNNSGGHRDNSEDYYPPTRSKLLQNQFEDNSSYFYSSLAEDSNAMAVMGSINKREAEELRRLRTSVKDYEKQIENLKSLKVRNKELQYEKKKLLKILREYESSRGQQNDIIVGCLYQLRSRMLMNLEQEKLNKREHNFLLSNSTQEDEATGIFLKQ